MSGLKKELQRFFKNEQAISQYRQGMDLLMASGILDVLARLGIPAMIEHGSDLNAMAAQAAWSNGYYTSIERLKYFVELFQAEAEERQVALQPDFGGDSQAIRKGHLTPAEVEKFLNSAKGN